MTPAVGDTIADRYELRQRVGSGGFATVWLASDADRDGAVALKVGSVGTHDADSVLARFERELATLGRFRGTITPASVVRCLGGDTGGERPYVALEYLSGDPLSERLGPGGLGSSVRRRIALDLAATMDFLHRNGVLYLDLRPENVIVRDSGRPVLIDFNTAADVEEDVAIRFEPDQFKPPELLREESSPGPPADVYAWGKLAFYLLTDAKVLPENVPEEGLDPLDFGATCSRELARVIERATAREPAARYADATEAAGAVAAATGRRRALVTDLTSGVACPIADGESMGRLAPDHEVPWLVLPDEGTHVSPRHARVTYATSGWHLEDTSLNGTYVGENGSWTHLLSARGRQRRDDVDDDGPARMPVTSAATIAPVHPEYGIELRLSPLDGEATAATE